jgi:hypothetical protein
MSKRRAGGILLSKFPNPVAGIPRPLHALLQQDKKRRRDFEGQGGHPISNLSKSLQEKRSLCLAHEQSSGRKMPETKESDESMSDIAIPTKAFDFHYIAQETAFT